MFLTSLRFVFLEPLNIVKHILLRFILGLVLFASYPFTLEHAEEDLCNDTGSHCSDGPETGHALAFKLD